MNGLPLDLIYKILFKMEPKTLMIMGCTNKSFKSLIFEDPYFGFNYSSPVGSIFIVSLLEHMACISISPRKSTNILLREDCRILDSRSGLLLLFIGGQLVVINPLTKRLQLIDYSGSTGFVGGQITTGIGFLPEQNRRPKRFKIVCMIVTYDTYKFEICDGDSWRLSKTTITRDPGSVMIMLDKSIYFDDSFHWLRYDGSIITFNPETEEACIIPSSFQESLIPSGFRNHLFAVDDKINCLTYIFWTKEIILIYTLQNSKWSLARKIEMVSLQETWPEYEDICCKVVAYDGKQLVVEERRSTSNDIGMKVFVYDMEANSWGFIGSSVWEVKRRPICHITWVFYHKFTPSLFSVENEHYFKEIVASNEENMSNLADITGFINKSSCVS